MKVKLSGTFILSEPDIFKLELGTEYVVYGIQVREEGLCYNLFDGLNLYPYIWNSVNIIDPRISRYWEIQIFKEGDLVYNLDWVKKEITIPYQVMGHSEMIKDLLFIDRLFEGGFSEEEAIFKECKYLMDHEFPDTHLQSGIIEKEGGWIGCPNCKNIWQEVSNAGIVYCPDCGEKMNNPFWK